MMKCHLISLLMALLPIGIACAQSDSESQVQGIHKTIDADQASAAAIRMRETVFRFFEGDRRYQRGDLIVQSQVAELQDYLRKTRGPILATHPKLRKQVLSDNARLARAFYRLGGRELLRKTAVKLGGYASLNQLCQTKAGRKILSDAILAGDVVSLITTIHASQKARAESADNHAKQAKILLHRAPNIFTAEDFINAITVSEKSSENLNQGK